MFVWSLLCLKSVRCTPSTPNDQMLTRSIGSEADSSNSFEKIPETFAFLLRNKGVFAATRTMVALLFADS